MVNKIARRVVAETLSDGTFDVRFEEYDVVAERTEKAHMIAKEVQSNIGEAYQSPFTYNAAYEAARMVLEQISAEQGDE